MYMYMVLTNLEQCVGNVVYIYYKKKKIHGVKVYKKRNQNANVFNVFFI